MSVYIIISVCMVLICLLDVCHVIDLSGKWLRVFYFVFAPHLPLFWMLFYLSVNHSIKSYRNGKCSCRKAPDNCPVCGLQCDLSALHHTQTALSGTSDEKDHQLPYQHYFCRAQPDTQRPHRTLPVAGLVSGMLPFTAVQSLFCTCGYGRICQIRCGIFIL